MLFKGVLGTWVSTWFKSGVVEVPACLSNGINPYGSLPLGGGEGGRTSLMSKPRGVYITSALHCVSALLLHLPFISTAVAYFC